MKVRDLIRQLQQMDGDHDVVVGLPMIDEDGEEEYEVVPVLPDVSQDAIDTDTGEQLVVVIFADPPLEDEDEEAANDNEN